MSYVILAIVFLVCCLFGGPDVRGYGFLCALGTALLLIAEHCRYRRSLHLVKKADDQYYTQKRINELLTTQINELKMKVSRNDDRVNRR